ncbi:tetratricopeptide repeat protein [Nitrospirillum sp. BR 11828]|uniref:tetratricopeptide repeat protein n=1 Tax=Nitrospirillum sp. BR 11828 TaxID=3104325 RepID=UPI002ACA2B10|nr:tetratricopeptide repeat protein [Nitrospirillum sp. BR 11828]MDZ5647202.1 tetratricopeptide repeat protein [Nitrospirillum sp. BR 11828]
MNRQDRRRRIAEISKDANAGAPFVNDMRVAADLHRQGRLKEAENAYRAIIRIYASVPEIRVAWSNLGAVLQGLGKLEEAVTALKKARSLNPNHPPPHQNLGMALLAQGKVDEALESFRRAVELNPQFTEAWHALGVASGQKNDLAGAEDAWRRTLELEPNRAETRFNLGLVLRNTGRLDAAAAEFHACATLDPSQGDARLALADTLIAMGRAEEAAQIIWVLVQTTPAHPVPQQFYARALTVMAQMGNGDAAADRADQWAATYPDSEAARSVKIAFDNYRAEKAAAAEAQVEEAPKAEEATPEA